MAAVLQTCALSGGRSRAFGLTSFYPIEGRLMDVTVEASTQTRMRSAGVMSQMSCYVATNTLDNTTTVRSRLNTANGNQTFTIVAGATGYFRDLANTDNIAAADLFNYTFVTTASGAGTALVTAFTGQFSATTNTVKRIGSCSTASTGYSLSAASAYVPIGGDAGQTTTQANTQCKFMTGGTLKNLFGRVSTNTRTTTTNFFVQQNGADTGMTFAVGAGATGFFEDIVNTAAVVSGDTFNYRIIGGAEVNTITVVNLSVEHETTDSTWQIVASVLNGASIAAGLSRFEMPGGGCSVSATEAQCQYETNFAFTLSKLTVYVSSNAATTAGTVTLRTNVAVSTALVVSMTALTTGYFDSGALSVNIVASDALSFNSMGGATGAILAQNFTMLANPTAAAGASYVFMRTLMGVGI